MVIPDKASIIVRRMLLDLEELSSELNKESQFESSNEVLELMRKIENLLNK